MFCEIYIKILREVPKVLSVPKVPRVPKMPRVPKVVADVK